MTLQEGILDVYEGSNEQDDLSPYVDGAFAVDAPGALRLREALARGAKVLSTWKFPGSNVRVRFPFLESEAIVETEVLEGVTPQATWPAQNIALDPEHAGLAPDNGLAGRLFVMDSTSYQVIASTGGAAPYVRLDRSIAAAPTDATYTLAKRDYAISGANPDWVIEPEPFALVGLFDIVNGAELALAGPRERYRSSAYEAGTPSAFTRFRKGLRLNVYPDEALSYTVAYWRYAQIGQAADDSLCELPDAYHDALVAWARWWALKRDGDFVAAEKEWSSLLALMSALRTSEDVTGDFDEQIMYIEK